MTARHTPTFDRRTNARWRRVGVELTLVLLTITASVFVTGCDDEATDGSAEALDTAANPDAPTAGDTAPAGDGSAPDLAETRSPDTVPSDADPDIDGLPEDAFVVVTFNTGTGPEAPHDEPPDDGYGAAEAEITDTWYGNGLSWPPLITETAAFFAEVQPDVVAFQEIFHPGECADIPNEFHPGFVCEGWSPGDPTVAQQVLGAGYQVACHLEKPDKCVAVKRAFGTFRGCDDDLCLDHLEGFPVPDCGNGARVARGVIDRVDGESVTVVSIHATSGFTVEDTACRVGQVEQVFVDLGDGEPGANGSSNLILGDLNTDPGRLADSDSSATRWLDFVGAGLDFAWISRIGPNAPGAYAGFFDIDHVVADQLAGECEVHGATFGTEPVSEMVYFDHMPVVCAVWRAR